MIVVVGAALVRDGQVLAALRREPVGWEFPGGKVEADESPARAIERECREELETEVVAKGHLATARNDRIELQLWHVELTGEGPRTSHDHTELRWVGAAELDELGWLDIDRELLPAVRALLR